MTTAEKREDNPRFHPLANVFPLMTDEEFEKLVADIDANGLAEPIIMLVDETDGKNKILDGRNRWLATQQLGIPHREKKFEDLTGVTDDPATFVWSSNVVRRHLNQGQIDLAAQALEELGWGGPRKTPTGILEEKKPKTRKQIADETGATERGMAKAAKVRRKAAPKVVKAVETGDLALDTAARIASFDPEEQEEIMSDPKPSAAVARRETLGTRKATTRKGPGPAVQMKGHMTGHQSGIRDVQLINKFWQENKGLIKDLDPADLRTFIKDLEESRRSASQLLTLLGEELIPEWTLDEKRPALLSTALNKIDLAAREGK
jgi:hypothetical protein